MVTLIEKSSIPYKTLYMEIFWSGGGPLVEALKLYRRTLELASNGPWKENVKTQEFMSMIWDMT